MKIVGRSWRKSSLGEYLRVRGGKEFVTGNARLATKTVVDVVDVVVVVVVVGNLRVAAGVADVRIDQVSPM